MSPRRITWIEENGCYRCTSHGLNGHGYPLQMRKGIQNTIARWILIDRLGELPKDVEARHTCDHTWCINPEHIVEGSHADNMNDRESRNRNGMAKLSKEQVKEVHRLATLGVVPQAQIAATYGIDQGQVSHIKTEKRRVCFVP